MKLSSKGSISIIEAYKLTWDSPQPLQEITWGRSQEMGTKVLLLLSTFLNLRKIWSRVWKENCKVIGCEQWFLVEKEMLNG